MSARFNVKQAARLAGVHLEPDEVESLGGQLGQLLAHMERLGRLDLDHAPGAEEGAPCPLRQDEPEGSPLAATILSRAPALEQGFFVVPRPGEPEA